VTVRLIRLGRNDRLLANEPAERGFMLVAPLDRLAVVQEGARCPAAV
jgi:hypothetical protein